MYLGRGFCVVASPPACAKSKWDSMWDLSISKWKGRGSLFSPLCPQARWTPQPSRETDMWIHSVPSEIGFTRSGDRDSISRDSAPSPVLICVFLPGASHVGDSLTSYKRKREQILYEFCPQTTVLWAVSFFLILYPLWAAVETHGWFKEREIVSRVWVFMPRGQSECHRVSAAEADGNIL